MTNRSEINSSLTKMYTPVEPRRHLINYVLQQRTYAIDSKLCSTYIHSHWCVTNRGLTL